MKRFFHLQLLCLLLLLAAVPTQKVRAQGGDVSYQEFYDQLSPYGQWVSDPQNGNVWVPSAGADFRPYGTRGHWVMTDYGNTWVSDYPWGWAPFHYGRWTYDAYYGWEWIPGYEWGPAWVSWRNGGGYYGWAPMGPGVSFGVAIGGYNCPDNWWVFVGPQYMYRHDFYHYWGGPRSNGAIIGRTTFVNNTFHDNRSNTTYVIGPRASQVQAFTHQTVPVYHIQSASRPGAAALTGNNLNIYHPSVNRATISTAHPANVVRAQPMGGRPQAAGAPNNRTPAFQNGHQGNNAPAMAPGNHGGQQAPSNNSRPMSRPAPQAQPQHQQSAPQQNFNHQPAQPRQGFQNHQQPQQSRPMQQAPRQQQQMQAPRQQPQMQAPHQQPQMQQHQQAPQPHMEAPHQEHEGGGRR